MTECRPLNEQDGSLRMGASLLSSFGPMELPRPEAGVTFERTARRTQGSHIVELHRDDEALVRAVATFLVEGLRRGDGVVAIATAERLRALDRALAELGVDARRALVEGMLIERDARTTLSQILVDGQPDREHFFATVGGLLDRGRQASSSGRVRVFDEMIGLLTRTGRPSTVLRTEQLWEREVEARAMDLLCAHVFDANDDDARALHAEIEARRQAESLRDRLLGLSAAADRAVHVGETFEPALEAIASQAGLSRCAILFFDGMSARVQAARGFSPGFSEVPDPYLPWDPGHPDPRAVYAADAIAHPALAAAHDRLRAEGVRAVAFLPLIERGRLLGALFAGAPEPRELDERARRLLQTVAGHVSRAIARTQMIDAERRARRSAEEIATRSARLQDVTAALSVAATVAEVAEAVVVQAATAIGASTGALWLVREHEPLAELTASVGIDEPARYHIVPTRPPVRTPAAAAITSGAPSWCDGDGSLGDAYPDLARTGLAPPDSIVAALPLTVEGRCVGALVFTFSGPGVIDQETRHFLIVVSHLAAQAVERARVFDRERRARALAEAAQRRTALLLEASIQMASSIEFKKTLTAVAHLVATRLADWCAVDLCEPGEPLRPLTVGHVDPVEASALLTARRRHPPWGAPGSAPTGGLARVLATGRAERYESVAMQREADPDDVHLEALAAAGVTSAMLVPMTARDAVFGVITFASRSLHMCFGADDLELAELLGRRAGMSIDTAHLYDEAQAATRAREEILAVVSHDLKNPLGVVLMTAENMLELDVPQELAAPMVRTAERLKRSAQRMSRLIDDLVDFDSMRTGRLAIEARPCAPMDIVVAAFEMASPLARARGLTLVPRLEPELPACAADKERVVQALGNLVQNALKISSRGEAVGVVVRRVGDELVFSVEDRGPGVPADELPRLFERYWRGEGRAYKGTGLGLTIAKGIVDAHGGRIWAESEVGRGSTFSFALPVVG